MARTIEVVPPGDQPPKRKGRSVPTVRRTRVVVKKVGPWSVLRFLGAIGVLHSIEHGVQGIGFSKHWTIHGGWLFSRLFMIGLVMVVFGAIVNLFAAFLYNVISDFVGGIELTLTERR